MMEYGDFRGTVLPLDVISVPPKSGQPPTGLIVLLHGWGANYSDLVDLSAYLDLPNYQFLCPNAPFPHPYGPGGRMWYGFPPTMSFLDLSELGDRTDLPEAQQLQHSRNLLLEWLRSLESTTGIPLSQTILAGFSQGGAMTLDVGSQLPLAALMILSGYLHQTLVQPPSSPVLIVHGHQDAVVPLKAAQQMRDRLVELNTTPHYHELDMGHEIRPEVLKFMQSFISEQAFPLG